jgi:hypothetical protein
MGALARFAAAQAFSILQALSFPKENLMKHQLHAVVFALFITAAATCAQALEPPEALALLAPQREAMKALTALDGHWRGTATVFLGEGRTQVLTQTERVGSLLGGAVKVIEGRGYAADGSTEFNALAVISFSPQTGRYAFRSYAQGHAGDFPFEVLADGFRWTMRFGNTLIQHTATVRNGEWVEIGERITEGQPPVRIDELHLRRVAATEWPAADAVPAK